MLYWIPNLSMNDLSKKLIHQINDQSSDIFYQITFRRINKLATQGYVRGGEVRIAIKYPFRVGLC